MTGTIGIEWITGRPHNGAEQDEERAEAAALTIQAAFAEREARLVGALGNLENANDRACGARPQKVYDAMIAAGMTDALIELDDARREARATLAALKDRTHG